MLKRVMFLVGLAAPATAAVAQAVASNKDATATDVNTLPVTTINLHNVVIGLLKRVTSLERQVAALNRHSHSFKEEQPCYSFLSMDGLKGYVNGNPSFSDYGNYSTVVKGPGCTTSVVSVNTGPPVFNNEP